MYASQDSATQTKQLTVKKTVWRTERALDSGSEGWPWCQQCLSPKILPISWSPIPLCNWGCWLCASLIPLVPWQPRGLAEAQDWRTPRLGSHHWPSLSLTCCKARCQAARRDLQGSSGCSHPHSGSCSRPGGSLSIPEQTGKAPSLVGPSPPRGSPGGNVSSGWGPCRALTCFSQMLVVMICSRSFWGGKCHYQFTKKEVNRPHFIKQKAESFGAMWPTTDLTSAKGSEVFHNQHAWDRAPYPHPDLGFHWYCQVSEWHPSHTIPQASKPGSCPWSLARWSIS